MNKQMFLRIFFLPLLKRFQQNYKYYTKKTLFKFWMSEEIIKHRGRFNSEAVTAVEQTLNNEVDSVTVKPQEDPEAPPLLELEKRTELSDGEADQFNEEEIPILQLDQLQRSRTKSQDCEYTILGFMQKKLRIRIMSQQFSQKARLFNPRQQ